jgi:hypothetical protein
VVEGTMSVRLAAAASGCFAVLAFAPAISIANSNHYVVKPGYEMRVHLHSSKGYRLNLSTGPHHYVFLTFRKGDWRAEYRVRGTAIGRFGARAKLADLGVVRLRFRANGRQHRRSPPARCKGPDQIVHEGVVEGRIRFVGEGGYTRVSVTRARAEVETWPRLRCGYPKPGRGGGTRPWAASFRAASFQAVPDGYLQFSARRIARQGRDPRGVEFRAIRGSIRGRVIAFHFVTASAGPSSFRVPEPKTAPENVVITPPPPFTGTGSLQRTPESTFVWEGDLSIQFPGMAPLPLTGPRFFTRLCALRGCVSQEPLDLLD